MDPAMQQAPEQPELAYSNCADFVEQFLLPSWRHTTAGVRWCAYWWKHSEAISRLDALWRSFEAQRHGDPNGMAIWWRDFADPIMSSLTRDNGTFALCDAISGEHGEPKMWPVKTPPLGMFGDERGIIAHGDRTPETFMS